MNSEHIQYIQHITRKNILYLSCSLTVFCGRAMCLRDVRTISCSIYDKPIRRHFNYLYSFFFIIEFALKHTLNIFPILNLETWSFLAFFIPQLI